MSSASNVEAATNAVQFAAGQVGKYFGGPFGQAYGMFLSGKPGLVGSLADAFDKYENGTLKGENVADILYDAAVITAGFGVLTGVAAPWVLTAVGVAGLGLALYKIYPDAMSYAEKAFDYARDYIGAGIDSAVNESFLSALNFVQRYDPLALDLDGDGIETVSANTGITFDFDGDGLKTGTGWVKSDDGFLVFDRNGNGRIDNGSELFGVDTVKKNGQKATNGFDALRDLDGNGDGVFDSADTAFAEVRVWRDLNQDGVAQANELKSLAEHGITAINLGSTAADQASNGNRISAVGTFVRADGSQGAVNGNQSLAANLDLASNPFYRHYTDTIAPTADTTSVPNMKGSGAVRDLREAATLNAELKQRLQAYAQTGTREQQLAQAGGLINAWAASSGYRTFDQRILDMKLGRIAIEFSYSWELPGPGVCSGGGSSGGGLRKL